MTYILVFFVSYFNINGPYQRLQCIAQHGFGEPGLVIVGEEQIESHFIGNFVQRVSLDDFGSHFGEETFVAVRVFFEQIFTS